jgi:hypothetical protein
MLWTTSSPFPNGFYSSNGLDVESGVWLVLYSIDCVLDCCSYKSAFVLLHESSLVNNEYVKEFGELIGGWEGRHLDLDTIDLPQDSIEVIWHGSELRGISEGGSTLLG